MMNAFQRFAEEKKRLASMAFCVFMVLVCIVAAKTGPRYKEQVTKVCSHKEEAGELTLRFYERTPNVPYLGMRAYAQYMGYQPMSLKSEQGGTCVLVNGIGEELRCDPRCGKIYVNNWSGFFDFPTPLEDEAKGFRDTNCHFMRITDVEYIGEPQVTEFDFAKYGIKIYSDQDDIYLPLSTLTNIMTDTATNYMLYNGEKLYYGRSVFVSNDFEGFFDSDEFKALFSGKERPDDIIQQSYADLCFIFDYLFFNTGRARRGDSIEQKGLEQTILGLGETGESIMDGLLSKDIRKYMKAMLDLFFICLDDGHCFFTGATDILTDPYVGEYSDISVDIVKNYYEALMKSPLFIRQGIQKAIYYQRDKIWGDKVYLESGKTAIIRLDSFVPDESAWAAYYRGEGDLPKDCVGTVVSGLKKASENPEIQNVIFDLSCNEGGCTDVLMAIVAMTTGQDHIYGMNNISGQKEVFHYEADVNLDGKYDERDKEARYDFNYGVITTRYAFSCGNLFPVIMQEGGAVLIGEPSGGGSCCVKIGTIADGLVFSYSNAQWAMVDNENRTLEGGCSIDLPLEPSQNRIYDSLISLYIIDEGFPDFENYYDENMLDGMMNEWFGVQEEMDDAA